MSEDPQHMQLERNFDKNITYHSMVDHSSRFLGHLFLANGGGVIALLTLTGHLYPKFPHHTCQVLYWLSFICFILGVTSAVGAAGLAYITQYRIFRYDKAGTIFYIAIGLSIVGLLLFVFGSLFGAFFISEIF